MLYFLQKSYFGRWEGVGEERQTPSTDLQSFTVRVTITPSFEWSLLLPRASIRRNLESRAQTGEKTQILQSLWDSGKHGFGTDICSNHYTKLFISSCLMASVVLSFIFHKNSYVEILFLQADGFSRWGCPEVIRPWGLKPPERNSHSHKRSLLPLPPTWEFRAKECHLRTRQKANPHQTPDSIVLGIPGL